MKNKTTGTVVAMIALFFILSILINAAVTWAITSFAILPIAESFGYELPFWPVFILLWVISSTISAFISKHSK